MCLYGIRIYEESGEQTRCVERLGYKNIMEHHFYS